MGEEDEAVLSFRLIPPSEAALRLGAGTLGGWKEAKASFLRFINIIDKTLSLIFYFLIIKRRSEEVYLPPQRTSPP